MKIGLPPLIHKGISAIGWLMLPFILTNCGDSDFINDYAFKSDSAVNGLGFDEMREKYDQMAQTDQWAKVVDYGQSIGGKKLFALEIRNPNLDLSTANKRPAIMVTEAIHGNEYLGLGELLPEWVMQQRSSPDLQLFFDRGGSLIFIPVVNPDGYEYHRSTPPDQRMSDGGFDIGNSWGRANLNKEDLNRTFPRLSGNIQNPKFSEPETKAIGNLLMTMEDRGLELKGVVDYHCCLGEGGSLLYPYGYSKNARLPADQAQTFVRHAALFESNLPNLVAGPTNRIINYPAPGSSSDYYYDRYRAIAFTFEGRKQGEVNRLEGHGRAISSLANQTSQGFEALSINNSTSSIALAVYFAESASGVRIAVASTQDARSATLCRGTEEQCKAGGETIMEFAKHRRQDNQVYFFNDNHQAFPTLNMNEAYTVIVTNGDAGKHYRGFMLNSQ